MKNIFILLCITATLLFHGKSQDVANNSTQDRHAEFAGIWFYSTIQQDTTKKQFPVGYAYGPSASKEVGKDHVSNLQNTMKKELLKARKPNGGRLLDYMNPEPDADFANSLVEDSLVFACALNYEHVEVQYESGVGKSYSKLLASIEFDLVICNFKDRRILGTLPARIIAIDAVPGKASENKKRQMLRLLYEQKLIPEFVKLAKTPYSSAMAEKTIGISNLRIDDAALKEFPSNYRAGGQKGIAAYISSLLSSSFYSAIKVPILPYSGGGDKIFYVMSERIKDTNRVMDESMKDNASAEAKSGVSISQDFLLKKPDYSLKIVIPCFLTHTLQANKFQKQLAFISYGGLQVLEDSKEIYKKKYKDATISTYPTEVQLSSSWINYEDALIKMFRASANDLKTSKKTKHIIQKSSIK